VVQAFDHEGKQEHSNRNRDVRCADRSRSTRVDNSFGHGQRDDADGDTAGDEQYEMDRPLGQRGVDVHAPSVDSLDMSERVSKAVLITGCSTGIGRATAERLAKKGWTVYATARRPETIADLGDKGCHTLALDVNDEKSMKAAVAKVEKAEGAVGALVNNAGYALEGCLEEAPMDAVRRQFETNVFGLVRLCQLVLPGMREQRWGRIVNISSVGGKLVFPGGGFYHATKHAVEALSDALRFEVAGFGIRVSIVEPGLIKTAFGDTATDNIGTPEGPYAAFNKAVSEAVGGAYEGLMGRFAVGPGAVARVIERAISSRFPQTRYRVTTGARFMLATRKVMPDRAFDTFLRAQFPRPKI
jgi:NAD(P)-dependent dehydrogenase (short-subunit alcohol dehydrogenase family)